ncbi:MAG: Unknown protein, partial [uncultured Aureispira sp.]
MSQNTLQELIRLSSLFVLLFTFFVHSASAQDVTFDWINSGGEASGDECLSLTTDPSGNIYATGYFFGVVDFDPGPGVYNLGASGDRHAFVQKLSPDGDLIWVKSFGSSTGGQGNAIKVDHWGNVYVTGFYRGSFEFNPGSGVFFTSTGFVDAFVVKYDSTGNYLWGTTTENLSAGGGAVTEGRGIDTDSLGFVYITGGFGGMVDFDPGPGVTVPSNTTNGPNIFVQKLDSAGSFIWVSAMSSITNQHYGNSIVTDNTGNVYLTGTVTATVDFDPGPGVYNLTGQPYADVFIQKLDSAGSLVWATRFVSPEVEECYAIKLDAAKNIYITGYFKGTIDFDPSPAIFNLSSATGAAFVLKLDSSSHFLWAKSIDGPSQEKSYDLDVDESGSVYITGKFAFTVDFDPGPGVYNLSKHYDASIPWGYDCYVLKLDTRGTFVWAKNMGEESKAIAVDPDGDVLVAGRYSGTKDFDPNIGMANLSAFNNSYDFFILKLRQNRISGRIFHDLNQDCVHDSLELGLANRVVWINPGNIVARTNSSGAWNVEALPIGTYTVTLDTSNGWLPTCSNASFTISAPNTLHSIPPLGLVSTNPCSAPDISIHAPFLRPGFSNQKIYLQACNQAEGTNSIANAYAIVTLDSLLSPQSGSLPFIDLGNNRYQVDLDTLYPGYCTNFWLDCTLSTQAILGQTLCMHASLFPVDSCILDTLPNPSPIGISPCNTPYDNSNIAIKGACINDSIFYFINNTGIGDMTCFSQVRLYINGQLIWTDSIQLLGYTIDTIAFLGDGRTWRLEVDQHPLHPGNSQPSFTIELCGNAANWTPNLVNMLPQDDLDPIIDIYCGQVTGS